MTLNSLRLGFSAHSSVVQGDVEMSEDLDKLMAEKVMGFYDDGRNTALWRMPARGVDPGIEKDKWHPTTDMNQAMMCVEKYLADVPINTRWELSVYGPDEMLWRVIINGMDHIDVMHESAPLAICQAIREAISNG